MATALAEQRRDAVVALTVIDTGPSADVIIPQGLLSRLALLPLPGRLLWRLQSEATIRKLLRAGAFFRDVDIPREVIDSIQGMTHRAFAAPHAARSNTFDSAVSLTGSQRSDCRCR